MSLHPKEIQTLLDRAAIHDVLARYYQGLDQGNQDQVRACFTDDVCAKFDEKPASRGIDALMDSFWVFKNHKSGAWKITTHFMGNLNFNKLEGDVAETETNAIAFLVLPGRSSEAKEQLAMRSLRYLDRLRRTQDGWRICERQHTLDWSCHVSTSTSVSIGERLMKRSTV
jgi:ketosteroid isomerase-like protein